MFLHKIPTFFTRLYPSMLWHMPRDHKNLYLTFDDGPIPELTPWVLDVLKRYNAKATFFCVGENVEKNPELFERLISEGHSVGNHTYNHLNGWKTDNTEYLKNSLKADEAMAPFIKTDLFRPPYGRMTRKQRQQHRHKCIVMWDVLTGDFSQKLDPQRVLRKTIRATRPGSIVVFHDNQKAEKNLKFVLPAYLEHFVEKNFQFLSL